MIPILTGENMKIKVMTILGTRPEIIRLSQVIKRLDADDRFEHILVHTGQNYDYELNGIFFDELSIRKPDYFLDVAHGNLGDVMGAVISKSYKLISKVKPEALLILGDTNSALSAISAKRLKCPILHMEAGNRCDDWNVPEMTNRVIVDHISDVNMPYSTYAENNLIREGLDRHFIFKTGSPMREVLEKYKEQIGKIDIIDRLGLEKGKYLIISTHREENVDIPENFDALFYSLNEVVKKLNMRAIFSVHPRTKKRLESSGFMLNPLIETCKPFGYFEYIKLQMNAFCVLSDSGSVSEESNILGFPAVLIRTSTERQEAELAGAIRHSGYNLQTILYDIEIARKISASKIIIDDYCTKDFSSKVVELVFNFCRKTYSNLV